MAKKTAPLLPATTLGLSRFGERLRLARLRRRLTAKQVAERAGMTVVTLRNLEQGGSGVTIGAYLGVMQVLGIEQELDRLAQDDSFGHELQDARLPRARKRAAACTVPRAEVYPESSAASALNRVADDADERGKAAGEGNKAADDWIAQGDFVSTDTLAALIKTPKPNKRERK